MLTIDEGYHGIETEILNYTKDAGEQATRMCALTYHANQELSPDMEAFVKDKLINNKTSPKIKEAFKVNFLFKNISRVNLARLTRDQCEAINCESQVIPGFDAATGTFASKNIDLRVIEPASILRHPEASEKFKKIVNDIYEYQQWCFDNDIAWSDDVRFISPMGNTVSLAMQFNARQFVACCNKRFLNSVNSEDNFTIRMAWAKFKKQLDFDFAYKTISELTYKMWKHILDVECVNKVEFIDELLGKELSDRGVPIRGDCEKPFYKKEQTAMYYELIWMYHKNQDMLMPGEKEMIERWLEEDKNTVLSQVMNGDYSRATLQE